MMLLDSMICTRPGAAHDHGSFGEVSKGFRPPLSGLVRNLQLSTFDLQPP